MEGVEIECIKGVLFFRFNKSSILKENIKISNLIRDVKVKNVVFNFDGIKSISKEGIIFLKSNYDLLKETNGKLVLCNLSDEIRKDLNISLPISSNELTALNCFNI